MRHLVRRRLASISVVLAAATLPFGPQALRAQQAGPIGTKQGDSVLVIVHRVPAANRAQYERWMTSVWWTAAQKAASKSPEFRQTLSERRRYVLAQPPESGMFTYLFVYPHSPAGLETKRKGVGAALELSGMPAAEIEQRLKEFHALGVKVETQSLVQQEYR